jgi:hypothetical protein
MRAKKLYTIKAYSWLRAKLSIVKSDSLLKYNPQFNLQFSPFAFIL